MMRRKKIAFQRFVRVFFKNETKKKIAAERDCDCVFTCVCLIEEHYGFLVAIC